MQCKICSHNLELFSRQLLAGEFDVHYYRCPYCGFVQTEYPYWIDEVYKNPISNTDTGIIKRNENFCKMTSSLLFVLGYTRKRCLDFAGGYGLFVRMMRDVGFDFYWLDKYSENIFAKGFEAELDKFSYDFITSFESYEHFYEPLQETEAMLSYGKDILFSTTLLPEPAPVPGEWYYYGLHHGQHVSFYSLKSLNLIAKQYGLYFSSNGKNIHFFTNKKQNTYFFNLAIRLSPCLFPIINKIIKSRTFDDRNKLIKNIFPGNESYVK